MNISLYALKGAALPHCALEFFTMTLMVRKATRLHRSDIMGEVVAFLCGEQLHENTKRQRLRGQQNSIQFQRQSTQTGGIFAHVRQLDAQVGSGMLFGRPNMPRTNPNCSRWTRKQVLRRSCLGLCPCRAKRKGSV
jgi:hypothetical protein